MAIRIEVAGSYNDKDIKRAQQDIQKLADAAGTNSKTFTEKFDAMGDALVSFGGQMTTRVTLPIVGAGAAMFTAFTRQEDAVARMTGALKANGGQAGVTADHIQDLAKRLQETTTFGDEATISAAGLLLTFHNIRNELGEGNQVFDRTLVAAQNLSAALGTDLESATMQLAKAMENPTRGMTALSRSGTTFTEQQREMIKSMEESGDVLGAQKMILEVVESQYGGMAEEMANTSSGKMKQAFNTMGDSFEEFGAIIAQVVDKVSGHIKRVAEFFQNLSDDQKELIVTVLGIAAAIGPLALMLGKLIKVGIAVKGMIMGVGVAMKFLAANPIVLIIAAVVALVAGLIYAYKNFEGFRNVVDTVFRAVAQAASWAWENVIQPVFNAIAAVIVNVVIPYYQMLWNVVKTVFAGIVTAIQWAWSNVIQPVFSAVAAVIVNVLVPYYQMLWRVVQTVFNAVATVIREVWTRVIQPIFNGVRNLIGNVLVPIFNRLLSTARTVWSGVSSAISTAWGFISGAFENIKTGLASVRDFFSSATDRIKSVFSNIGNAISGPFRTAFQAIKDLWNNTLGGKGFTVPDLPGVPGRGQRFEFPRFDKGGVVPGIPGEAQLAVLHAGEMVLRQSQIDRYRAGDSGGGDTYNITINGMVGRDKRDVLEFLAKELPRVAVKAGRSQG